MTQAVVSAFLLYLLQSCQINSPADVELITRTSPSLRDQINLTIGSIPTPSKYTRLKLDTGSFGEWLRSIPLKKDKLVYLYNGTPKKNQHAQFAVLDIPVGNKDLQQCADAIMRLRAEYFFSTRQLNKIEFKASDGTDLSFREWQQGTRYKLSGKRLSAYTIRAGDTNKRKQLEDYLEFVFSFGGTYSLAIQLQPVHDLNDLQPGDVFNRSGSPGHAMMVADVAISENGKKIFMLVQSYMPAQDIHVVKNPGSENAGPWYEVTNALTIITPEWTFRKDQLRTW